MTTPKKHKKGPTTIGGTQKSATEMAASYREHIADPTCRRKLDRFGVALNDRLEHFLPDKSQNGILKHQEADLRQEAALFLLQSYFKGNPDLSAGLRSGILDDIANQLDRSIWGAIKAVSSAVIKQGAVENRNHQRVAEACQDWSSRAERTNASSRQLIEAGLLELNLPKRDAEILGEILVGRARKEICEEHGISPSGLSRLIKRLRMTLVQRNKPLRGVEL